MPWIRAFKIVEPVLYNPGFYVEPVLYNPDLRSDRYSRVELARHWGTPARSS